MNRDLEYYLNLVSRKLENCTKSRDKFVFRCNICKDSKTNKKKRRAYLLKNKGEWFFYCHNNCGGMSALKWMKEYFHSFYKDYITDNIKNFIDGKENEIKLEVLDTKVDVKQEYKNCNFVPIMSKKDSQVLKDARDFCTRRKIPFENWKKFFVCTDGELALRIVIPFYGSDNKIKYFQARKIYDNTYGEKYIGMIGKKCLYNFDFVDKEKEIIVTEGMIDSMFIDNAIAFSGTSSNADEEEKLNGLKCFFVFDNDETGRIKSKKYLNKGRFVFNWSKYLNDVNMYYKNPKDINDLYIFQNRNNKYNYSEFAKYFTNSFADEMYF